MLSNKVNEDLRLPGDVLPSDYTIRLLPFIEEGNFTTDGHIDIFVDCVRDTNSISMNAADITFKKLSIAVVDLSNNNNPLAMVDFIDEQSTREIVTIRTAEKLMAGKRYKISMDFVSILNDELRGFYRSSYMENGVRKWLAVTQMEAPDARRAFPCFDEPNMKAVFTIVLGRKITMRTASNMNIISSDQMSGMPDYVWDYYQTTVKMSSYLVAFLVSEFEDVATTTSHRVPFRLWVKPESRHLAGYSLSVAPGMQEFYESYFKIAYPLPKQDLAAIPDFSAGAMENWGLVTYRESALLIDVPLESRSRKQSVADINAHELAHQWFGDLVTTDWWNTIWLNEGFATYVEFLGTNAVEPDFRMLDQFVVRELHYVFGVDALETSRPINLPVTTPAEISRMFDAISYDKGSCIIRMAADFIGLETFNRGLTRYLNARSYKNAVEDDLWLALQQQVDEDGISLPASVKDIMDTWTLQMGFPLITVTRDYSTGGASVSQDRFLIRKNPNSTDTHVYLWWVPLTHTNGGDLLVRKTEWISKDQPSTTIGNLGASSDNWVIFNYDQQNLYRVAYDSENYRLIAQQLMVDHGRILDNNRAQLLDDAFVLASVHLLPYKSALDLSLYLKYETEYVPWNAVLSELSYIDSMLYSQPQYSHWLTHMMNLVTPYYSHVGFQESTLDAHLTVFARSDAMSWACKLQIADCVDNSKAKYAELMKEPDNSLILSPNQKSVILKTGVENGGQAEYDFAFTQYTSKYDTSFLIAAASSKDVSRLNSLLNKMLDSESGIRLSDVNTLFNNVASNPVGNALATDFLVNQWDAIEQSSLGTGYFVNFFRYVCNRQNTQAQLDRLLELRNTHADILGSSNTVQQGIDVVIENIKWMELHQNEIGNWLADNTEEPTTIPTSTTTTTTTTTVQPTASSTTTTTTQATTTPSSANGNAKMNAAFILAVILSGMFFIKP
ncbi:hypothetical protein DAPPUDRAFT_203795 [Daphnia pulex]|uniref:Aminopeptidase n=1 Tax=Daphnia pulex TaxID=6669 RepID=E9HM95_DAPPU|nr:hypothetical protein DAPPUDRAFT_203795 [Daphnia pulex]|eukprot:EFX67144.1 hypothetical protein DAPPUDRAFT_203795 [Daphnia pulex]